jgi:hypothetical protein
VVSVGCSLAETLASSSRQRPRTLVLPLLRVGCGSGSVVRLGWAVDTLLGPEDTSPPLVGLCSGPVWPVVVIPRPGGCGWAPGGLGLAVV